MCKDLYCKARAFEIFRAMYGICADPGSDDFYHIWIEIQQIAHNEMLTRED